MKLEELAYEAYRAHTGGISLASGQPIPEWSALRPEIQAAWDASTATVLIASSYGGGTQPRERRLREALEFYAKHEHWMQVCEHADNSRILIANGKYHTNGDGWEEAAAALSDQPPPDPRDEALRLAEEAIEECKTYITLYQTDSDGPHPGEAAIIHNDYIKCEAALTAIAAVKGEK